MPCTFYRHFDKDRLSDALLDQARSKKVRFQATPDIIRSGHQARRSRLTLNGHLLCSRRHALRMSMC